MARALSALYDLIGKGFTRASARRVMSIIEAVAKGQPDQRLAVPDR